MIISGGEPPSAYPTSVFFPYRKDHPAYEYSSRFYEEKLHVGGAKPIHLSSGVEGRALGGALDGCFVPGSGSSGVGSGLQVVSVSGARDAVWSTAKEILSLMSGKDAPRFYEIGVVARSLEPYSSLVAEVFRGFFS